MCVRTSQTLARYKPLCVELAALEGANCLTAASVAAIGKLNDRMKPARILCRIASKFWTSVTAAIQFLSEAILTTEACWEETRRVAAETNDSAARMFVDTLLGSDFTAAYDAMVNTRGRILCCLQVYSGKPDGGGLHRAVSEVKVMNIALQQTVLTPLL